MKRRSLFKKKYKKRNPRNTRKKNKRGGTRVISPRSMQSMRFNKPGKTRRNFTTKKIGPTTTRIGKKTKTNTKTIIDKLRAKQKQKKKLSTRVMSYNGSNGSNEPEPISTFSPNNGSNESGSTILSPGATIINTGANVQSFIPYEFTYIPSSYLADYLNPDEITDLNDYFAGYIFTDDSQEIIPDFSSQPFLEDIFTYDLIFESIHDENFDNTNQFDVTMNTFTNELYKNFTNILLFDNAEGSGANEGGRRIVNGGAYVEDAATKELVVYEKFFEDARHDFHKGGNQFLGHLQTVYRSAANEARLNANPETVDMVKSFDTANDKNKERNYALNAFLSHFQDVQDSLTLIKYTKPKKKGIIKKIVSALSSCSKSTNPSDDEYKMTVGDGDEMRTYQSLGKKPLPISRQTIIPNIVLYDNNIEYNKVQLFLTEPNKIDDYDSTIRLGRAASIPKLLDPATQNPLDRNKFYEVITGDPNAINSLIRSLQFFYVNIIFKNIDIIIPPFRIDPTDPRGDNIVNEDGQGVTLLTANNKVNSIEFNLNFTGNPVPIRFDVGGSSISNILNYLKRAPEGYIPHPINSHMTLIQSLLGRAPNPIEKTCTAMALKAFGDWSQGEFTKDVNSLILSTDKNVLGDAINFGFSMISTGSSTQTYIPQKYSSNWETVDVVKGDSKTIAFIGNNCNPNINDPGTLYNILLSKDYLGDPFKLSDGQSIFDRSYSPNIGDNFLQYLLNPTTILTVNIKASIPFQNVPNAPVLQYFINITPKVPNPDINSALLLCDFLFSDYNKQLAVFHEKLSVLLSKFTEITNKLIQDQVVSFVETMIKSEMTKYCKPDTSIVKIMDKLNNLNVLITKTGESIGKYLGNNISNLETKYNVMTTDGNNFFDILKALITDKYDMIFSAFNTKINEIINERRGQVRALESRGVRRVPEANTQLLNDLLITPTSDIL